MGNRSKNWIDACRDIVTRKQHASIRLPDGRRMRVDSFTASAVVSIADAINAENLKKLRGLHPLVGIDVVWKLVNGNRA